MRICNEPSAASLWPPSFFSFGSFLSYQHFICELNEAKTAGKLAHNARQRKQCHFNRIKEAYETRRRVSCFFTSLCSNNCTRDASCLWYNSEAHPRAVTPFLPSYNVLHTAYDYRSVLMLVVVPPNGCLGAAIVMGLR